MSSASDRVLPFFAAIAAFGTAAVASGMAGEWRESAVLRVCSDPNNLPYSNASGEGFENALARLVARDLGRTVEYTWWPQRRGFLRNTVQARRCDVVMGVPAGTQAVQATRPYYRSTYVFVTRRDRELQAARMRDAELKRLRIGVHAVGAGSDVPPMQAFARHGMLPSVHAYSIYGDYSRPSPPGELIGAVATGDIDVAVAWGPIAGYFAQRQPVALDVSPVPGRFDTPLTPMTFSIAMGVRPGERELQNLLDGVIARRQGDIERLLAAYGVPLVPLPE